METEIKITEKPLFTVKTVKKKHLEPIRETANREVNFDEYNLLGLVAGWSAVLIKHKATGHYRVVPQYVYAEWIALTSGVSTSEAYRKANELEQLFLD